MSEPVNYALLDDLLADESLSLRECARRAGCSDWSARRRYRELSGDDRAMKTRRLNRYEERESQDVPSFTGTEQAVVWSVIAVTFIGVIAFGWYVRRNDFPPYCPPEEPMA